MDKLQYRLLCLVGLLECRDTSGLEDVVLGQVGDSRPDVCVLESVDRTLQVGDLIADDVGGRIEPVDGGANLTALSRDRCDSGMDGRQRGL